MTLTFDAITRIKMAANCGSARNHSTKKWYKTKTAKREEQRGSGRNSVGQA
jgi:hypothetical protein